MFHRVETCFPSKHKAIRDRIMDDLELYLSDNVNAWTLESDGNYSPPSQKPEILAIDAQAIVLERWCTRH